MKFRHVEDANRTLQEEDDDFQLYDPEDEDFSDAEWDDYHRREEYYD